MSPIPQARKLSSFSRAEAGNDSTYQRGLECATAADIELTRSTPAETSQSKPTTRAVGSKTGRLPALDFTKGTLVLVMVLYHWLNYFVRPEGFFYIYLRFLPPAFICISGFLISHVYLAKYGITDARLPRRLAIRGLKILGIFTVLNALASLLIPEFRHGQPFVASFSAGALQSIYVTGNVAGGRSAAFTILVPISYLLILSACGVIACRMYKHSFHVASLLFLLGVLVLDGSGFKNGILELLTIGLVGISIGYISVPRMNAALRHPSALVFAYLCYLGAITAWEVPFLLQLVGVCLTLMLIYWLGTISGESHAIPWIVILLGKYSLLGYIAQIAILQLLRRGLRHGNLGPWDLGVSFLVAIALTVVAVAATDRARVSVRSVNTVYTAVFG